jgi:hypothetical protein
MPGDSSHLLHHPEVVPYRPALHELAVDQTVPTDVLDRETFACRRYASDFALVSAAEHDSTRHYVAFCNHVHDVVVSVEDGLWGATESGAQLSALK